MYVYVLSEYDEYGAENAVATLDRSRLLSLVDENWPGEQCEKWREDGKSGLAHFLAMSDADLSKSKTGKNCHTRWGGMQLHVIKLAE